MRMKTLPARAWAGAALALSVAACATGPGALPVPGEPVAPKAGAAYRVQAVERLTPTGIQAEAGGAVARAVDGVLATGWVSPAVKPARTALVLRFGDRRAFSRLRIRTGAMPEGTTFKGDVSDDGLNWEPASGRLKNTTRAMEDKDLYGTGRYLRLRFYNSDTHPVERFEVYEIEVYGEAPGARPAPSDAPTPPPPDADAAHPLQRYYPDWRAIAPMSVFMDGRRLRFDTAIANLGPGYLQIRNRLTNGKNGVATQEVLDDAGTVVLRKDASRFIYFEAHGHNHVDDIARYELREGSLDGPTVRTSTKVSFCVEDSFKYVRSTTLTSKYPDCTPELMGVTPGYADLYSSNLPGQEFDVGGLPSGVYYMVVTVDPFEKFLDYRRTNNMAWTRIQLDAAAGTVSLLERSR
ncbi:MAG: lysyl oxidase family protein [Candidatus Sericytochromatia bacterium]